MANDRPIYIGTHKTTDERRAEIEAYNASLDNAQSNVYVDYNAAEAYQQQNANNLMNAAVNPSQQQIEPYWTPQRINQQYVADMANPNPAPDEFRPGGVSREAIAAGNEFYRIKFNDAPVTEWKADPLNDLYYQKVISKSWGDPNLEAQKEQADPLGEIMPKVPDYGAGKYEDMPWIGKLWHNIIPGTSYTSDSPSFRKYMQGIVPAVTSAGGGAALGSIAAAGLSALGLATPVGWAAAAGAGLVGAASYVQSAFGVKIPLLNSVLEGLDIMATKTEQLWRTGELYIHKGEVENAGQFIWELAKLGVGAESRLGGRDEYNARMAAASTMYETKTTGLGDTLMDLVNRGYNVFAEKDVPISKPGEAYMYNRGLMAPVEVTAPEGVEATDMLTGVVKEIVKITNPETQEKFTYREAQDVIQQWAYDTFGSTAFLNEMVESSVFDPMNLVPFISAYVTKQIGKATGNAPLVTAADLNIGNPLIDALPPVIQNIAEIAANKMGMRGSSKGIFSTLDTYKNVLRYGTKLDAMSLGQMKQANLTPEGKFAEYQPTDTTGRRGWLNKLISETPESKAMGLTALTSDMITAVGAISPDYESFKQNIIALASDIAPDMNSPVAGIYGTAAHKTILDNLKAIVEKGDYKILFDLYDQTAGNRSALIDISTALGKQQKDVITLAQDKPEVLKQMIADYAGQHEGKLGNMIIDDGGTNAVDMLQMYTGKNPQAWNENILRFQVTTKIADSLSDMLIEQYGIKADNVAIRLSNLMKKAQSVVLLGFSPSYIANNLINNIVTRASVGAIGGVTLDQYRTFMENAGIFPARFAEDAGILRGDSISGSTPYGKAAENIADVKRKGDWIDKAGDAFGKTKKVSLDKLNSRIESTEGQRAYGAGIMQFFHRVWKPDNGFRRMDKALETMIEMQSPGLSKLIYSTISQHFNMADIERALYASMLTPDASEVLTNIGKRLFPNDPYVISEIFDKAGITAEIQDKIRNATTRAEREQIIRDIRNRSETYRDRTFANEMVNMAEAISNIATAEGLPAVHEILTNMAIMEMDHWIDNRSDFTNTYDTKVKLKLSNDDWRKVIGATVARQANDYKNFNAMRLQTYDGIIRGLGFSELEAKDFIRFMGEQDAVYRNFFAEKTKLLKEAYRKTEQIDSRRNIGKSEKTAQIEEIWNNFNFESETLYKEAYQNERRLTINRNDIFVQAFEKATGADGSQLTTLFDQILSTRDEMHEKQIEMHKWTAEIKKQYKSDYAKRDQIIKERYDNEFNPYYNQKIQDIRDLNQKVIDESQKDGFVARAEYGYSQPKTTEPKILRDQIVEAIEVQNIGKAAEYGRKAAQTINDGYLSRDQYRQSWLDQGMSEKAVELQMAITDALAKNWERNNPGKNYYTEGLRIREITREMSREQGLFQWGTIAETDIDTPQFKQAFGKTKVVDDVNNPKVVYHGSPNAFDEFSYKFKGAQGQTEGYGFYFTDDISIAEGYAKGTDNVYKSYVNIEKPLSNESLSITKAQLKKLLSAIDEADMKSSEPEHWFLSNIGDVQVEGRQRVLQNATDILYAGNANDVDLLAEIINIGGDTERIYRALKQTLGYDGIITKWAANDSRGEVNLYIPFLPEQIKSVYNKGDWDMNNPNMLFQTYAAAVADGSPWYSHMETVIADKFPEKMNAQSVRNWLQKQGVTKQELQWSGMDEYLDSATGQVTKADLQRVVDMERMKIDEVVYDYNKKPYIYDTEEVAIEKQNAIHKQILDHLDEQIKAEDPNNDYYRILNRAREDLSEARGEGAQRTLFTGYQLALKDGFVSDRMQEFHQIAMWFAYPETSGRNITRAPLFMEYVTSGDRKNYREHIITLPKVDAKYRSDHWDGIVNPAFHVRFDDRIDSQGRKILFIEEMQSDWAQHLKAGETAPLYDVWERKAIQRMMNYAADGDYDMVAWAPGSEHMKRYSMGAVVDEIMFQRNESINKSYIGAIKDGKNVYGGYIDESQLADYIGKQKAELILNSPEYKETGEYKLSGKDMEVGDTWPLKFYDQDIANATRKVIKKYGSDLETTLIDTGDGNTLEVQAYKVTDGMAEPQKLFQTFQDGVKGKFEVIDGDVAIRILQAGDVSTMVHESGHAFRRTLNDSQMEDFAKWNGFESAEAYRELDYRYWNDKKSLTQEESKRYIDAEEKFARGWEQYLTDGVAPTNALKAIFQQFTTFLLDIYRSVKEFFTRDYKDQPEFTFDGKTLDINEIINNVKLRDIFDSMLVDSEKVGTYAGMLDDYSLSLELGKAAYGRMTPETLRQHATLGLNQEILKPFASIDHAELYLQTMDKPYTTERSYQIDRQALSDAINSAKADPKVDPFSVKENTVFKTVPDGDYQGEQATFDNGRPVKIEYAEKLIKAGYDPDRLQTLKENLYEAVSHDLDDNAKEIAIKSVNSIIDSGLLTTETIPMETLAATEVWKNTELSQDMKMFIIENINAARISIYEIQKEIQAGENIRNGNIPPEGLYIRRSHTSQIGNHEIVADVFNDGQFVAYYPYGFNTELVTLSDGTLARPLGISGDDPNVYVYIDSMDGIHEVNVDKPRGYENAYVQSEGETLVNRGTPVGATPMIEPDGSANNEILNQYIYPVLDEFIAEYEKAYNEGVSKNLQQVDQDTRVRILKYLDDVVKPDMASAKFNAMKYGEFKRDAALLNYSKTYGVDSYLTMISPYQFWYTRSVLNWAKRLIDKPAYLTMAMRYRALAEKNKKEEYPYRLNNLFRIPLAGLQDWMGGDIFVDFLSQRFPFLQFISPIENLMSEKNTLNKKAYSILDEMIEADMITEADKAEAIKTKDNDLWRTVIAQAKLEYGKDPSVKNLFDQYLSPPLWLSWAKNIYQGKGSEIGMLPITRFGNTVGTLTDNTFLEGMGQIAKSALTAPEKGMRKIAGLDYKEFGEFENYNIWKQIMQMVVDGDIGTQQGLNAMVEMKGDIYNEAVKRQREENAIKTQGALPIYEMKRLLQGEDDASIGGVMASLIFTPLGAKVFPAGERVAREMQSKLNQAYIDKDNGDKDAVSRFWRENPEYYARLASFKDNPEEMMRYVLHTFSKNFYYGQPKAQQQAILNNYGPEFYRTIIDPSTSNWREADIDKMAFWAQGLTGNIPDVERFDKIRKQQQTLQFYAPQVVSDYDMFMAEGDRLFPGQSSKKMAYYALDKTQKTAYRKADPLFDQYLTWEWEYKQANPNVKTVTDDRNNYYDEVMAYDSFSEMQESVVSDFDHWAVTGKQMRGTTMRVLHSLYDKYANPNFNTFEQYLEILKQYR